LDKHSLEKSTLSAELLTLSEAKACLEGKLTSMEAELRQAYADKAEESMNNEKQICGLNQDLANLTSKFEVLLSEKAAVDNKLATLLTDMTARDEKMNDQLSQLNIEHAKIMEGTAVMHKSMSELRARVSELEELVEKQKLEIAESAEGKREAIRQLCFSLEHYRSGYHTSSCVRCCSRATGDHW
jgi:predicted nuclease with TOPRIM domain